VQILSSTELNLNNTHIRPAEDAPIVDFQEEMFEKTKFGEVSKISVQTCYHD
jgi:hypothetical protein